MEVSPLGIKGGRGLFCSELGNGATLWLLFKAGLLVPGLGVDRGTGLLSNCWRSKGEMSLVVRGLDLSTWACTWTDLNKFFTIFCFSLGRALQPASGVRRLIRNSIVVTRRILNLTMFCNLKWKWDFLMDKDKRNCKQIYSEEKVDEECLCHRDFFIKE